MLTNDTRRGSGRTTGNLSGAHRQMLERESGISAEIVGGRGYTTVSRADVPDDFPAWQRRNGLLIPLYSPDGTTTGYQLRPDRPRRDRRGKKPIKYETPTGARIIADVHPRMLGAAADSRVPLWITEGTKKGDALASRDHCAVSLAGVWMFRPKDSGDMLPCFDHVALSGRRVFVVYDSDVMRKVEVAMALDRLVSDLEGRGARVLVVYLPDAPDGGKQGADDYLAAGGTVEALEEIARPFDAADATRERMDRDAPLRDRIAALWRIWRGYDWRGRAGHTRREVLRAMIEEAVRRGQCVPRGVLASGALRPLVERVGVGRDTISNALDWLEAARIIAEDKTPRPAHKGRYYVLLAPKSTDRAQSGHKGKKHHRASHTGATRTERGSDHGVRIPRAPFAHHKTFANSEILGEIKRLRWPYCARVYDQAARTYVYTYVRRLGKIDGRVIEVLVELDGEAPVEELAGAVGQRVRDLRRRSLARLQTAELVMVEGSRVSLAPDWPEKLGLARELGDEYGAEDRKRDQHRRGRKAYRDHMAGKNKADRAPSEEEMSEAREARKSAADGTTDDLRALSALAAAMHRYLERNPRDAAQPPGWMGATLWAHGLYPERVTPAQSRSALAELGGEDYRRGLLQRVRQT